MNVVSISPNRQGPPISLQVNPEISLTHWGIIRMLGADFFPSSFQIKYKDIVIYIDPVGIEQGEKADFIFLTHAHPDHYSPRDIKQLVKESTVFVSAKKLTSKLVTFAQPILELKPGEELDMESFTCKGIAAYNNSPAFLGFVYAHPRSAENLGYVLTFPGGTSIYHMGDTHHVPEMDAVRDIEVAMVPVGGRNLTMGPEDAAAYCNQLKPEKVVPIHFTMSKAVLVEEFGAKLDDGIEVCRML